MLQPKRTKYRKQFKGHNAGLAMRGSTVAFGDFGLKATDRARMTAREIEAARRAMARYVKRGGQIWIRVFPGRADHQEAARSAHGQRQGQRRVLGRQGQARQGAVRDGRGDRGDRARGVPARRRQAVGVHDASSSGRCADESQCMLRQEVDASCRTSCCRCARSSSRCACSARPARRQARPVRQGAQEHRAREDGAARA